MREAFPRFISTPWSRLEEAWDLSWPPEFHNRDSFGGTSYHRGNHQTSLANYTVTN